MFVVGLDNSSGRIVAVIDEDCLSGDEDDTTRYWLDGTGVYMEEDNVRFNTIYSGPSYDINLNELHMYDLVRIIDDTDGIDESYEVTYVSGQVISIVSTDNPGKFWNEIYSTSVILEEDIRTYKAARTRQKNKETRKKSEKKRYTG